MSLRDFTPQSDPMMEELYAIRDANSAKMLAMGPEERAQWLKQKTDSFLAEHGYELRPHPTNPQWEQMVKKEA